MQQSNSSSPVSRLFALRNQFGSGVAEGKLKLMERISKHNPTARHELELYYNILLFLIAYPDNREVYNAATQSLQLLVEYLRSRDGIRARMYNSGITGSKLGGAFSFEMTKWLYQHLPDGFSISVDAEDGQLQSIIAALLPKVESEILQDSNENWKSWLHTSKSKPNLAGKLLEVFEQAVVRPEVRDELWNALGIMVEVDITSPDALPSSLVVPYFHRSLVRKNVNVGKWKPVKVKLNAQEAEAVVAKSKMILFRHMREMDPVTFTTPDFVSLYQLPRGLSVALLGMPPGTRHPIDSYISYVAFKNGLPVGYGGAWVLFDSSRTALNIFPAYRGGESKYIFEQVLELHRQVFRLRSFTADTYQLGNENSDGIKSGSFWLYFNIGFRPLEEEQRKIAAAEELKIKHIKGYRTPADVLKKLALSRVEWVLHPGAFRYDATDIAIAYNNIVNRKYSGNRQRAEERTLNKLASLLQIKNVHEVNMHFMLRNWCVLLLERADELRRNHKLRTVLKQAFILKTAGSEEEHIRVLQRSTELKLFLENIIGENLRAGEFKKD